MPSRVHDPDRKGKVESAVALAPKTPLKGLRFESIEEAQAYLDKCAVKSDSFRQFPNLLASVPLLYAHAAKAGQYVDTENSVAEMHLGSSVDPILPRESKDFRKDIYERAS